MKILHTADIHLGDLAGPTKDGKNLRRLDTLDCMDAIVSKAIVETPDITIIAGDLFNRARVWADTALEDVNDAVTRFIRPLCRASGSVVLLFGTANHDNPWAFEVLGEITKDERNLHIYTTPKVETIGTEEGPVQIMAVPGFDRGRLSLFCPGADKETENRNATALINDIILGLATQLDRSKPAIMVAHYTVCGAEIDNGSTFLAGQDVAILPATIDATGVDLACFGHIHRHQRLGMLTAAYYCGSPNQLNFNDEGIEHGFYIYDIFKFRAPGAGIGVRFIRTPERRHYTYRIGPEEVADFIRTGEIIRRPPELTDAIVRVRYSCTAEQDKALNRAELQKRVLAAGAFWVAEVLPEEVEELNAKEQLTEHDGPAEALTRWLELNEITGEDARRLAELAAPIIKEADDGRDADRHTGAFVPLSVEVKNYRSYTEATFDFSSIHMAMVNGRNGIGKSSLFMDSIADCIFEQSRKEDVGGWVRDGTKSGSITFTFLMGDQQYRIVRTRTKTGRGTLALHRYNLEAEEWEDDSDTTMRLTQQRIERLLGMDCNTFCSIALIRQDAYGLFLEADSGRRMEVLSALLGLDIYTRMEEVAKGRVSEQRRLIAATKERISILSEKISAREQFEEDDRIIAEKAATLSENVRLTETALKTAEQNEAMRFELLKQATEKANQRSEYRDQAAQKEAELKATVQKLEEARGLAEIAPAAQRAATEVQKAREQLETLASDEERLRSLEQEEQSIRITIERSERQLKKISEDKTAYTTILGWREGIEAAQQAVAALVPKKEEAQRRLEAQTGARAAMQSAKEARDKFLAESRIRIGALSAHLEQAQKEAEQLSESGCIDAKRAACKFLASAHSARNDIPTLTTNLSLTKVEDKARYEKLNAEYEAAKEAYTALGDPAVELKEIAREESRHAAALSLAPKLAAAEAKLEELAARAAETKQALAEERERLEAIEAELPDLRKIQAVAEAARASIKEHEALAGTLHRCMAAEATVAALEPQASSLREEAVDLRKKADSITGEIAEIEARIPEDSDKTVDFYKDMLTHQRQTLTDYAAERGAIKAKMESITEAETQAAELRKQVAEIATTLNDYATLVQAFGLDGIQYMIIRGVVPEIMRRSNDILAAMTGGSMAVDIRTEKEQRSTKQIVNSLEVWISSLSGSIRPYQSHSGGEKVKIALAVTLGLADVKARRAGVQLGMLFIDEPPFLDSDGTEAYADALTNMAARNPGMRILAISHDPAMKARFPQNITVSAGEHGSVVEME